MIGGREVGAHGPVCTAAGCAGVGIARDAPARRQTGSGACGRHFGIKVRRRWPDGRSLSQALAGRLGGSVSPIGPSADRKTAAAEPHASYSGGASPPRPARYRSRCHPSGRGGTRFLFWRGRCDPCLALPAAGFSALRKWSTQPIAPRAGRWAGRTRRLRECRPRSRCAARPAPNGTRLRNGVA